MFCAISTITKSGLPIVAPKLNMFPACAHDALHDTHKFSTIQWVRIVENSHHEWLLIDMETP